MNVLLRAVRRSVLVEEIESGMIKQKMPQNLQSEPTGRGIGV